MHWGHAVVLQGIRVTNARQHEKLRGVDCATGEDHFAPRRDRMLDTSDVQVPHPRRASPVKNDPAGHRPRHDSQVRTFPDRVQVRNSRTAAPPVAGRELKIPHAFLLCAVVVGVKRVASGLRRLDPRVADGPLQAHVGHRQGAIVAMEFICTAFVAFRPAKQRQDILPTPADIAQLPPAVIVLGLPPHVEQAVDRRRAAKHLATRPIDGAAVQPRIRFGLVAPVQRRVVHRLEVTHGNMDPWVGIPSTGLQKHHFHLRISAQAVGNDTTRRTRPDDHIISFHSQFPHQFAKRLGKSKILV